MPVRDRFYIVALSAVVGCCVANTPVAADDCVGTDCTPTVQTTAPQQPLRLNKFRRQPIALGKPTRVVKTDDGRYARIKMTRRAKPKRASKPNPEPPQFMPVVVSPEAAAALAMQSSVAQAAAEVRVVEADELNELDHAADTPLVPESPLVPIRVPTTNEPAVQVASAEPLDEVKRGDTPGAVAQPTTAPNDRIASAFAPLAATSDRTAAPVAASTVPAVPATPAAFPTAAANQASFDLRGWLSRLGSWLSDAFGSLVVAVRSLFA